MEVMELTPEEAHAIFADAESSAEARAELMDNRGEVEDADFPFSPVEHTEPE